jgi:hypothetical protein
MIQDLGIHLDGDRTTSGVAASDEAMEIRRRVFWTGAFLLAVLHFSPPDSADYGAAREWD